MSTQPGSQPINEYAHSFGRRGATGPLHRADCRTLADHRSVGYPLGRGLTPQQLREQLVERGETREDTKFCRICLPGLEQLPQWQAPVCGYQGCGKPMTNPVHVTGHVFIAEAQWHKHFGDQDSGDTDDAFQERDNPLYVAPSGTEPTELADRLGALWSPDFDAYAEGRVHASEIRCALCRQAPCQCPPFGTPEYFELIERRHGRR